MMNRQDTDKSNPTSHSISSSQTNTEGLRVGFDRERIVDEIAAKLHDLWREPRRIVESARTAKMPEYEPRIKEAAGVEYDIANLHYRDLPEQFQRENHEAAKGAVGAVLDALQRGETIDDSFVEKISDTVHQQWMERNGSWAPQEQMVPYVDLPEVEKEKDRAIARAAIQAIKGS